MYFFISAFTLCIVALLAFTAEAHSAKKTKPMGNAKMMTLIDKMTHRVPSKAEVTDDDDWCDGVIWWCGDRCCPDWDPTDDSRWVCCDGDSPTTCATDPDLCDPAPKWRTNGHAKMNSLLMKMKIPF